MSETFGVVGFLFLMWFKALNPFSNWSLYGFLVSLNFGYLPLLFMITFILSAITILRTRFKLFQKTNFNVPPMTLLGMVFGAILSFFILYLLAHIMPMQLIYKTEITPADTFYSLFASIILWGITLLGGWGGFRISNRKFKSKSNK